MDRYRYRYRYILYICICIYKYKCIYISIFKPLIEANSATAMRMNK